jgi:hypothetical protein
MKDHAPKLINMQVQQSQGKDTQKQNDIIKLSQCIGEGCKITYILNVNDLVHVLDGICIE